MELYHKKHGGGNLPPDDYMLTLARVLRFATFASGRGGVCHPWCCQFNLHLTGGLFRAPFLSPKLQVLFSKLKRYLIATPKLYRKTKFVDLEVTDDVTGQVKVKIIDIWSMFTLWALTVVKQVRSGSNFVTSLPNSY